MREKRSERLKRRGLRVVVLDDDPTGVQTVHGCLLLTSLSASDLEEALEDSEPYFYVLTNTRAMDADQARETVRRTVRALIEANRNKGCGLVFISRGDSTLRGHYPLEMETIVREAGMAPEARFLIPAFFEAGRLTVNGVHYLKQGQVLIPCHESEFARDSVFGYRTADLSEYVSEKTGGRVKAEEVASVPRELLVSERMDELSSFLDGLPPGGHVVVNACGYDELDVFSEAVLGLLVQGREMVFQSSASFVKSLVECPPKPLVVGGDAASGPGLVIVGSHVGRTSEQLDVLTGEQGIEEVEVDVARLLREEERIFEAAGRRISAIFDGGRTPVLFTTRKEIVFDDMRERLAAGRRISAFLSRLVAEFPLRPAFLIAKGGITSHDVLVRGLGVRKARVLGQASAGVPVLSMPPEHRWAGMPYVIFPGNVGDSGALARVYRSMSGNRTRSQEENE